MHGNETPRGDYLLHHSLTHRVADSEGRRRRQRRGVVFLSRAVAAVPCRVHSLWAAEHARTGG